MHIMNLNGYIRQVHGKDKMQKQINKENNNFPHSYPLSTNIHSKLTYYLQYLNAHNELHYILTENKRKRKI